MSLVKGPIIILLDERPLLRWKPQLNRILFDIFYGPPDIARTVQKYFPSSPAENRVVIGPTCMIRYCPSTCISEMVHYFLRKAFMFANENVHVVRHDRAGIARIFVLLDDFPKRFSY